MWSHIQICIFSNNARLFFWHSWSPQTSSWASGWVMNQKISLSLYKNATLIKSETSPQHRSVVTCLFVCLLRRPFSSPISAVCWSRWARGRNRSASWRGACAGWHRSGRQLPGGWMTNYATSGEGRKGWAWDHPDTLWQEKKPKTALLFVMWVLTDSR